MEKETDSLDVNVETNKVTSLYITLDGSEYEVTIQPYKGDGLPINPLYPYGAEPIQKIESGMIEITSTIKIANQAKRINTIVVPAMIMDDIVKSIKDIAEFMAMN